MRASIPQTQLNFLNENIRAASLCLESNPIAGKGYTEGDVLGFPTALLLFSVIDTIGGVKKSSPSFEILRAPLFGSQDISVAAVKDLYEGYRNPFMHNNILVFGRTLTKGDSLDRPFTIKDDKVVNINLSALLRICEKAVQEFENTITDEEIYATKDIKQHVNRRSIFNQGSEGHAGSVLAKVPDDK